MGAGGGRAGGIHDGLGLNTVGEGLGGSGFATGKGGFRIGLGCNGG